MGKDTNRKTLITILVVGIAMLGIFLVARSDDSDRRPPVSEVVSDPVSPRIPPHKVEEIVGVVVPRETAEIASHYEARLEKVYIRLGQEVSKGQLLAKLDDSELLEKIAFARTEVISAKTGRRRAALELQDALKKRKRRRQLGTLEIVAEEEVESANTIAGLARIDRSHASSQIALREAELKQLEHALATTEIRAPFDGVIAQVYEGTGNVVSSGVPLLKLNTKDLWVRFAAPPDVMSQLEEGSEIELSTTSDFDMAPDVPRTKAVILNISPEVNTASAMVIAEAEIHTHALGPGPPRAGSLVHIAPFR